MANEYVIVNDDRFENRKYIELKDNLEFCIDSKIYKLKPRRTITEKRDFLVLDVDYEGDDWKDLDSGSLIFHLNGGENIKLPPHFSHREKWYSEAYEETRYREIGHYDISEEDFLKICNAKTAELRFSGSYYYNEFICDKSVMIYFRLFYNGAYDSKSYTDTISEYEATITRNTVASLIIIIIIVISLLIIFY